MSVVIIISQQRMAATSNGVISSVFQRPTTITIVSYFWGLRRILRLTILREIAHYDTDILEWCSRKIRVTVSTRLSWIFSPCTVLQISQTPFPYNFLIKYIPISLSASGKKRMTACPLLTYEEQSEHKEITIVVTSFYFWLYQSHVRGSTAPNLQLEGIDFFYCSYHAFACILY